MSPSDTMTAAQSSYIVVLCQGKRADGDDYWAYLQLSPDRVKSFKAAQAAGSFQLEEYGQILKWGIGATVPQDVLLEMESEHGVNHAYERELKAALKKKKPDHKGRVHKNV